ncbi:MAG: serine hydrolase domain-containing protein [bacterium]
MTSLIMGSVYVHAANEDYSAMLQDIDNIRQQEHISALVVLITDNKQTLLSRALGKPNHNSDEALTLHHYIRIGSVSKMFIGIALTQLQETHKINLNMPVSSVVDNAPFENSWSKDHPVRIAHLMEHTAGLTDMSRKEFSFNTPVSLEEAFNIGPNSRRLRWRPGLHSSYSNSGAGIAAYVIEQTTGSSFESFVRNQVFKPMGLASATYIPTEQVLTDLVTGYNTDGKTSIPYWHTLYRAFAGINVRSSEMIRVVQMYLSNGIIDGKRVFNEQTIRRMETPRTSLAARSGLEYGYSLGLYHFIHGGFEFIGHGGDADGYLSYLAYSRSLQLGYFVFINAYNGKAMSNIREIIEDKLIENAPAPEKPESFPLNKEKMRQIAGTYVPVTYRFGSAPSSKTIQITEDQGELYTIQGGRRRKLIAVSSTHFRRSNDPVATIAIIQNGAEYTLQGDLGNFKKKTASN